MGYDVLCVHVSHPLAVKVISLFECKDQSALPTANGKLKIDPKIRCVNEASLKSD